MPDPMSTVEFAHLLTRGIVPMSAPVPEFLPEAVALLAAAAVIAYLCSLVKVVPIAGFLLAGVAIGPYALGLVEDIELVEAAAELGVVLLLFTIGIEFRLEQLNRIRRAIFGGGGLQVGLTIVAVVAALLPFGVSWRDAFFTGCLVSLSSTAIVLKVLGDRRATNGTVGRQALGILIFQDLAVVAMVLVVPMLGEDGGGSALDILRAIGSAVGIVLLVLVVARRLVPPLVEAVARTCSPEIFLLSLITLCFGTAYLTSLAGVSLALGAFLAGLLVSESRFSHHALGEIMPLQILFSATFFVSVGMLLDLGFLLDNLPLVLAAVLVVVALKTAVTAASVRLMGLVTPTALGGGLLLAQVGEFSFVLNQVGADAGLSPAGLGERGGATFVAASVILLLMTPFLADAGLRLDSRGRAAMRAAAAVPAAASGGLGLAPEAPGPAMTVSTRPASRIHVATGGDGVAGATGPAAAGSPGPTVTVPLPRSSPVPAARPDPLVTPTPVPTAGQIAAVDESAGEGSDAHGGMAWSDHVIVNGWGPAGEAVARALSGAGIPFVVVTRNPEGALAAEGAAMAVVRGSTNRLPTLQKAGIATARVLVVADDDPETTGAIVAMARTANPALQIVVRTDDERSTDELLDAGADAAFTFHDRDIDVARVGLVSGVLDAYAGAGLVNPPIYPPGETAAEAFADDPDEAAAGTDAAPRDDIDDGFCTHLDQVRVVTPQTPQGCEECLALGDRWVHLRLCLSCGHVGCCDSSPNKHASAHSRARSHPIIQSFEPGEDWRWCYLDLMYV